MASRHGITCTRSFGRPQHEAAVLAEAIATFIAKAAEKLRRQGLVAHVITVLLGTNRHAPAAGPHTQTAVVSLPLSSNDTSVLTHAALQGLHQLRRPGVPYQRAGVLLSGLEPAGQQQLGLFAPPAAVHPRSAQLMATLDKLNARFGRRTVQLAAAVPTGAAGQPAVATWAGRSAHRSPRYTTGWDELWELR